MYAGFGFIFICDSTPFIQFFNVMFAKSSRYVFGLNMELIALAVALRALMSVLLAGSKTDGSTSVVTNQGSTSISTSWSGCFLGQPNAVEENPKGGSFEEDGDGLASSSEYTGCR
jgi:hypothetical protein